MATRERSSLGLEADQGSNEARITGCKPVAHTLKLLLCHRLASASWVQQVGCKVLGGDGILEALADQLLVGMECRLRQKAKPGISQ